MPKFWPQATIRELLALADAQGESVAQLESAHDAEAFRYAIYYFRQRHNLGEDLCITLDDNKVVITKRQVPEIKILQQQAT